MFLAGTLVDTRTRAHCEGAVWSGVQTPLGAKAATGTIPIVFAIGSGLVGSARRVATYDGPKVYDLTDVEFM